MSKTVSSPLLLGVMGDPIAHSISPILHEAACRELGLSCHSATYRVAIDEVDDALHAIRVMDFVGMSVTMPDKEAVANALVNLSETAALLGAVNCICRHNETLRGENTDGQGFLAALRHGLGVDVAGMKCLVVGAGGAARAVILALSSAGASKVIVVNRTPEHAQRAAELAGALGCVGTPDDVSGVDLVVDATPASMERRGVPPIKHIVGAHQLDARHLVIDLVYTPLVTPWLGVARANGATILGGLGMLVHQAAAQIELWTGTQAPVKAMWEAAISALQRADED